MHLFYSYFHFTRYFYFKVMNDIQMISIKILSAYFEYSDKFLLIHQGICFKLIQ